MDRETSETIHALGPEGFGPEHLPLTGLTLPPAGEVHLWYLDLHGLGSPLQPAGAPAPARMKMRQERTVRRFYLRLLLGAYLQMPGKEVRISRQVKGKPVLDAARHGQRLDFSIAGSDGCCLIGICTTGLLGVDLEPAQRRAARPTALAHRYFSAREARAISAHEATDLDRSFIHTWACKEAVVKAAGHGIANQLDRFSVSTDPHRPPVMQHMLDDRPDAWRLALVQPAEKHLGAVALRHPEMNIRGFHLQRRP